VEAFGLGVVLGLVFVLFCLGEDEDLGFALGGEDLLF